MTAYRRPTAALLAVALLFGCASVREAGRSPIEGNRGGVRVAVFADDDTRSHGQLLRAPISGALERKSGDRWDPVFRSLDSSWAVVGLQPGHYRVRFDVMLDATGRPERLEKPVIELVEVRRGEIVDVELVLDHVSPLAVAAVAAVAIVVTAVLFHEWLEDADLPEPPPPPTWALEAAFWITLDLASTPGMWATTIHPPQVTSHFPGAGNTVVPGKVRVVFCLSEPIDTEQLGPDSIVVEDANGVELPGEVSWDGERWWLIWEPDSKLAPETRYRARLAIDSIADDTGQQLAGVTGFEFGTGPQPDEPQR